MPQKEIATFGAGCFWHVEEAFRNFKGVTDVVVGYMGGTLKDPSYEDVCTDKTGHAEVVQVVYDPALVSYEELVDFFWSIHDPTTVNRQGPDVGTQYRSVIFYRTEDQKKKALKSKENLEKSKKYSRPIVTEISPESEFYRAEEYHQRYLLKRDMHTC